MNEEMMEFVEKERAEREKERLAMYEELNLREKELSKYRDRLRMQERELEDYKADLKKEQLEREQAFRHELAQRDKLIKEREQELFARQARMEEQFLHRQQETEKLRDELQSELARKEKDLNLLFAEVEKEKEKYREDSRQAIESKSQKFVDSALSLLEQKESKFHKISRNWSIVGALSIVIGVVFAIYTMIFGADSYYQTGNTGISYYLYTLFRGLIVVGLFGALARYAFVLSNSFMHESLKSGERLHAIKFGEFYLDAYGADAEWDQLKEAFEHWNISGDSAFSKKATNQLDSELDLSVAKAFEKAVSQFVETQPKKA
ncbi:hypothetical protein [Thiohalomonas denitrificans]|uniref:hypothetical protein n=1 Tax=Thiohalomonas denitrificans TaxID=415747 RepID=UPI0026EEA7A7|nr:hypothetical protein [Thiohalomonas denitrificans]